jgi:hypothetical protein
MIGASSDALAASGAVASTELDVGFALPNAVPGNRSITARPVLEPSDFGSAIRQAGARPDHRKASNPHATGHHED